MAGVGDLAMLAVRQAASSAIASATVTTGPDVAAPISSLTAASTCDSGNDYDGRIGIRISALFVILFASTLGACFPTFARKHKSKWVPSWAFFVAKFFGSGIIVATAFIHLLAPANDALTDPCLTGPITEYDWVEGIALMTIFVLFFVELMASRFALFSFNDDHDEESHHSHVRDRQLSKASPERNLSISSHSHAPGDDHLGHSRTHVDTESGENGGSAEAREEYAAQMTAIFILEFGVIFHSIFIGLTLAVSGQEFDTLYVVLVFHQTFEGLGLGSRLATTPWPKSKEWTPYIMGCGYGFSTPIAIAVGLGIRQTYAPGSQTALIVNGVFDSISAGILIYTGLVELMAHEFMFSPTMRREPLSKVLSAYGSMCFGAGLMALLGKWA